MIAYHSVAAREEFWTEHWGNHSVGELLAIARTSPLTDLIVSGLPPAPSVVLEAGCGPGQYVVLLRERGWQALGADWSVEALAECRKVAPVPLAGMDLTALAIRDGAVSAYVSLGVVEHDVRGPDAILAEARRVLAPGGVLIVSVPYVNGVRRLSAFWIRRRQQSLVERGAAFYQYAFSRRELMHALRRHGFRPGPASPYGPGYYLGKFLPRRLRRLTASPATPPPDGNSANRPTGRHRGSRNVLRRHAARWSRRLLYSEPSLRLFGHMLLVVATRAADSR